MVKIAKKLKANLFISRLAGHGSGFESTKSLEAKNFLEDAAEAVAVGNKIGNKVILMGFSAGGSSGSSLRSRKYSPLPWV